MDFSRWQIVAVVLGPRPNAGYAVHFLDYCGQGEELAVRYEESLPGPDAAWAPSLTYPFDVAALPAGGPIRFERRVGPRQCAMSPVVRCVPAESVPLEALSPCTPEQFTAFPTQAAWSQFWCQYGQGPSPDVHFGRGYTAVGVLGLPPEQGVSVSEVTRAGDCLTITLGPCDAGCPCGPEQHSLLLIVPARPTRGLPLAAVREVGQARSPGLPLFPLTFEF